MEKEYLVSYYFRSKKGETGYGRIIFASYRNIKTRKGIKEIEAEIAEDVGGPVSILNIIELDAEEQETSE